MFLTFDFDLVLHHTPTVNEYSIYVLPESYTLNFVKQRGIITTLIMQNLLMPLFLPPSLKTSENVSSHMIKERIDVSSTIHSLFTRKKKRHGKHITCWKTFCFLQVRCCQYLTSSNPEIY